MKTLKEIHAEARKYDPDSEPLQDAFVAGARWALTGKYYKPAELFDNIKECVEKPPAFDDWWCMYNKKRGRKKAEAKWNRLTCAEKTACMKATPAYVSSTPDVTYRKDPLTYLNGECWNDDIITKQDDEQQRNIERAQRAARLVASAYSEG